MAFSTIYYSDIPEDVRKKYKVAGTPEWLCDRLVSCVPVLPQASYLEPCVGRGTLIQALLRAGVREEQIIACDILDSNIEYCKRIWKNINYRVCDLYSIQDKFDFVLSSPPWLSSLPSVILKLVSLADKKCVLEVPFFAGMKKYKRVNSLVSAFNVLDLNDLVQSGLSNAKAFRVSCIEEFGGSPSPEGLDSLVTKWVIENNLTDYFTLDVNKSVPKNLVLYTGQDYFLPINPLWHFPYTLGGFSIDKARDLSILGSIKSGRNNHGLVYHSKDDMEKAREHYSSVTVKKMLACGVNFGWRCLKAV